MSIDDRVVELGLTLPAAFQSPTGRPYPISWVRIRGDRCFVSGHLPLNADGTLAEPLGRVGDSVSAEEGTGAARAVGLAMLGSLQRELGSLERVTAWLRVLGMVNIGLGNTEIPSVINGFSELILEVFGPRRRHRRCGPH